MAHLALLLVVLSLSLSHQENVSKAGIKESEVRESTGGEQKTEIKDLQSQVVNYQMVKETLKEIFSHEVPPGREYDSRKGDPYSDTAQDRSVVGASYEEEIQRKRSHLRLNPLQEFPLDNENSLHNRRSRVNPTSWSRLRGVPVADEKDLESTEARISPLGSWDKPRGDNEKLTDDGDDYEDKGKRQDGAQFPDSHGHHGHEHTRVYLNEWLVHVAGGMELAATLAQDLGYSFHGQVGNFADLYRMVKDDHPHVNKRAAPALTDGLAQHSQVVWAEQQFVKERTKRGVLGYIPVVPLQDGRSYSPSAPLSRSKRNRGLADEDREMRRDYGSEDIEEPTESKIEDGIRGRGSSNGRKAGEGSVADNTEKKEDRKRRDEDKNTGNEDKKMRKKDENTRTTNNNEDKRNHIVDRSKDRIKRKRIIDVESQSNMAANALMMEKKFNDELWDHQWYLFDTRTRSDLPRLDLQVVGVWEEGVVGKGVRVQILDDGLEWRHSDIISAYDPETSYDLNGNTSDPTPRYDAQQTNSHGTRCAGEIAMKPDNNKCGVGVAYGAKLGAVRMLDGPVSDVVEGEALAYGLGKVDVVSCSWGPNDDGTRVEGPGTLAQMSIKKGVAEGRNGLGTIYVWAAGNGGSAEDNCNCDGYASSIMTLSISSASETGKFPWYGERCTSTLAAAYSSGAYTDQKIATTDLNNTCTVKFSGTSAAAPLASGIIALALQVNGNMTWRDMQHAVVWSSEWGPLSHNTGWFTNARGLKLNPRFGFGLINARNLVDLAKNWAMVGQQRVCRLTPDDRPVNTSLRSGEWVAVKMNTKACEGEEGEVRWLEHVQVVTTINYSRRGALSITLTSPQGTVAELLTERVGDVSSKGFTKWPFMSVHTWGENPRGTWTLNISDATDKEENGSVGEVELILYGTKEEPEHMKKPRVYKIKANQVEERETRDKDKDKIYLSAEQLRTLSWDQLVVLLTKSTRSTMSKADVEYLLKEGRLESALHVSHKQRHGREAEEKGWRMIVEEMLARW